MKPPVITGNKIAPEKLELARKFRKEPTSIEAQVWEWLRDRRMLGLKFRRQQIIEGFIADFYCAELRLALEIDGTVHDTPEAHAYDEARDAAFNGKNIQVLRICNDHCTQSFIQQQLEDRTSPPDPLSLAGEEEQKSSPSPFMEERPRGEVDSPSPLMERGPGGEVFPAAGQFTGWPDSLRSFQLLDPCCGSGHFLVAAFLLLTPMRMATEGLSAREAVDAVLRDNLHGLELDPRCVEIAAFALALAAWTYPDAGGYRPLPPLNVACCGLKVSAKVDDWAALVPNDAPHAALLRQEFKLLHAAMQDAPLLGSLLDPWRHLKNDLAMSDFGGLQQLLSEALTVERPQLWNEAEEQWDAAVSAQGLLTAARLLAQRYHLVITNVPYLARGKQSDELKKFCETHYGRAKNDLANVFLERCLELAIPPSPVKERGLGGEVGIVQIVMPQNWLFLGSYKKQREHLLKTETWSLLARLGMAAFDIMDWWAFNIILITLTHSKPVLTICCTAWMPVRRARWKKKWRCCGKLRWWQWNRRGSWGIRMRGWRWK